MTDNEWIIQLIATGTMWTFSPLATVRKLAQYADKRSCSQIEDVAKGIRKRI
jgi:hypothetical protein